MSSRDAVYNGSKDNSTRGAQTAIFHSVPNHPNYNLDRFVSGSGQSADRQLRAPPGFGQAGTEAKSIAQSQTRASAVLHAFDTKFIPPNRPPH
ncbi:hypothetical protein V8C42DRAFT_346715 [Trichoderma barbatum]